MNYKGPFPAVAESQFIRKDALGGSRTPEQVSQSSGIKKDKEEQVTVFIDTDFPAEEALEMMKQLKLPNLKKLTTSLF